MQWQNCKVNIAKANTQAAAAAAWEIFEIIYTSLFNGKL